MPRPVRSAVLARIGRHLRHPTGLPALAWKNLRHPFSAAAAQQRFDRQFGIDTSGWLMPAELGLDAAQANPYDPMPVRIAEYLLGKVATSTPGFTFVDLGAGKGRVLLLASRYPFGRLVGVELSTDLCRIARTNIAAFARHVPQAARIEIANMDAAAYPIPAGPCVIFLFNPFGSDVMQRVAHNIQRSYRDNPRKIVIVYYAPTLVYPFEEPIYRRELVTAFPRDLTDRYGHRYGRKALILETTET